MKARRAALRAITEVNAPVMDEKLNRHFIPVTWRRYWIKGRNDSQAAETAGIVVTSRKQ
jgi:hypothetical protein